MINIKSRNISFIVFFSWIALSLLSIGLFCVFKSPQNSKEIALEIIGKGAVAFTSEEGEINTMTTLVAQSRMIFGGMISLIGGLGVLLSANWIYNSWKSQ